LTGFGVVPKELQCRKGTKTEQRMYQTSQFGGEKIYLADLCANNYFLFYCFIKTTVCDLHFNMKLVKTE